VAWKDFRSLESFKTRKVYKEVFLNTWANYEYLNNSFVKQYFKADFDVKAITMATWKIHKENLQISVFANYLKN